MLEISPLRRNLDFALELGALNDNAKYFEDRGWGKILMTASRAGLIPNRWKTHNRFTDLLN